MTEKRLLAQISTQAKNSLITKLPAPAAGVTKIAQTLLHGQFSNKVPT